jgi:hypothetical protein
MFTINPKEIKTAELHSYMLAAIAPRLLHLPAPWIRTANLICHLSAFSMLWKHPADCCFFTGQEGPRQYDEAYSGKRLRGERKW